MLKKGIVICILSILILCEEMVQELEVMIDNDGSLSSPYSEMELTTDSMNEEVNMSSMDCDVFFPNSTCQENFSDLKRLNSEEKLFEYFDRFLSCEDSSCIEKERLYLHERIALGDPNAQYTISLFTRFGIYNYTRDELQSAMYLSYAVEAGSALAALSEGTRYQCGYQKEVNSTKMMEIILPAWQILYNRNESLFEALYVKSAIEWPTDVMSVSYDVSDYLDVLRGQMSTQKYRITQRQIYLSKKNRNLKALMDMYKDSPEEQHLYGFMYLEGLFVNRDYSKALYYFDNSSHPLFNSSYHVFGRGIIHFYGLGLSKNETLGCDYINQANRLKLMEPIFTYYLGICKLRQHLFSEAYDLFSSASFSQFQPAINAMLRMRDMNIGQRLKIHASGYFGSILINRMRDFFFTVIDRIRTYNIDKNTDGGLLYALLSFDINLSYWGTHIMDLFEKRIWVGSPPQRLFSTTEDMNNVYHDCMKFVLSLSPDNYHVVDVAKAYMEGNRGYSLDLVKAREMLINSKLKSAYFYLGVMDYVDKDKTDLKTSKMYFDKSIGDEKYGTAALFYRFQLIGHCVIEQIKRKEWRKALLIIKKSMIIDHDDLLFDNDCTLLNEIENKLSLKRIVEWLERFITEERKQWIYDLGFEGNVPNQVEDDDDE